MINPMTALNPGIFRAGNVPAGHNTTYHLSHIHNLDIYRLPNKTVKVRKRSNMSRIDLITAGT